MTGITPTGFDIDREFPASPEAVFAAWTTADAFAQWFGGADVQVEDVDYEPEAGRSWSATMKLPDGNSIHWAGEFVEVEPVSRLVLTVTDDPSNPTRLHVTVELTPTEGGTLLHMEQEADGFTDEQKEATISGWQTFLDVLERVAVGG